MVFAWQQLKNAYTETNLEVYGKLFVRNNIWLMFK